MNQSLKGSMLHMRICSVADLPDLDGQLCHLLASGSWQMCGHETWFTKQLFGVKWLCIASRSAALQLSFLIICWFMSQLKVRPSCLSGLMLPLLLLLLLMMMIMMSLSI
jgi:hypothetical protein